MKMKTINKKYALALLLGASLAVTFSVSAQEAQKNVVKEQIMKYEVPASGPLELFGQTLNPYFEFYEGSDNKGYKWDQLKHLVPDLLPDAKKASVSANVLCENILKLARGYANEIEVSERTLAFELIENFPDVKGEPELVDEVSLRLNSSDPKDLEYLLELSPEKEAQIMMAKDMSMKAKTMVILADAAIMNCIPYAKNHGYQPYLASYYLEKYDAKWPPAGSPQ